VENTQSYTSQVNFRHK